MAFPLRPVIAWCLYDWACASYSIIITTFIFATYFTKSVAANPIIGTYQWANAMTIAGLIIAISSPVFGAIADHSGHHKRWLFVLTWITVITTSLLWFVYPTPTSVYFALIFVVISAVAYEVAQVFYNSFLLVLVPSNYIGRLSGWGWGSGYLGGIVALSITLFAFINAPFGWFNTATSEQIRICAPFVGLWLAIFSLPLFLFVPNLTIQAKPLPQAIKAGCLELLRTLKTLPKEKNIFLYLIAHMIYTDSLNTLFAFGGIYAAGVYGLTFQEVLIFGITMNIAAGIGAIALAWVDDFLGSKATVLISLCCLSLLGLPMVFLHSKYLFWGASLLLCLFVGPVQSASRSLMVHLIASKEQSAEMLGLYALSGRITAFIGPWLLGFMTLTFQSQRAGMGSILIFFVIGAILLLGVSVNKAPAKAN